MSDTPRLVLIDDNELTLAMTTPILEDAGFDVRAVTSLRRFLNTVLDWKPHLIVTDLYMPEMSGADLCTWLRKQVETARTPVIICSSASDAELAQVAQKVGADGYVSKEGGPDALAAKLRAFCEEVLF